MKFIHPKKYHEVIKDITKFTEKHINDPRSNDRFFERDDAIQSYTELFNMNIDTWKSKNKLDQMMIYMGGVQLVATLIIQLCLFHRTIFHIKKNIDGEILDIPVFPNDHVPLSHKPFDKEGKMKDYSKIHSMGLMKYWYRKLNKSMEDLFR